MNIAFLIACASILLIYARFDSNGGRLMGLFDRYDDITARRHKGNPESVAANPKPDDKAKGRADVMRMLEHRQLTSKEIAAIMGKPLNCISGRLSELKALGLIEPTGYRRSGCAVLRRK